MAAPRVGSWSPWGTIQTAETVIPGMVLVTTASHGGAWLSPELEAEIPAKYRDIGHRYAPAPWYEEDCDIVIPFAILRDRIHAADSMLVAHLSMADHAAKVITENPYYKPEAR